MIQSERPRGTMRPNSAPDDGRRHFVLRSVHIGGLLLAGLQMPAWTLGCRTDAPACFDPDLLSTPEQALRKANRYLDAAGSDATKQCSGCQFFRAERDSACGHCEILSGPVSGSGVCDAWSQARDR